MGWGMKSKVAVLVALTWGLLCVQGHAGYSKEAERAYNQKTYQEERL